MEATTLTRAAAWRASSAAALMPTGKPSEAPTPHSRAPTNAATRPIAGPRITSSAPTPARANAPHSTLTRPKVSSQRVPSTRPTVIAETNAAKPRTPTQASVS